jgi:hypothetical protein
VTVCEATDSLGQTRAALGRVADTWPGDGIAER